MSSNMINGFPFVVRHIRNYQDISWDDEIFEQGYSPFGGVSFGFIIDNEQKQLTFHFSICKDDERFVRKIAYNVLRGRITKKPDEVFIMQNYNREYSLVENAVSALREWVYPQEEMGIWPYVNQEAKLISIPKNGADIIVPARKAIDSIFNNYDGSHCNNFNFDTKETFK